jgi:hypothetical protein
VFVSYLYFLLLNLTRLLPFSLACLFSQIATSASSSQVDNYGPAEQKFLEGGAADASASKKSLLVTTGCVDRNTPSSACCSGDIEISPDVTAIGYAAFQYCSGLVSVDMPSVKTIGQYAFIHCSGLVSVDMPSVQTIGDQVFQDCSGLVSVNMPSVQTIGNSAFRRNSGLVSIDMPSVQTIGYQVFQDCSGLVSVDMPSVQTIDYWAFGYCSGLVSVDMPSVKTIGQKAFGYCSGLVSIDMPSVKTIGEYATLNCSGLVSITLGESVNYIGWKAFGAQLHPLFPVDSPPCNANTTTLYVPASLDESVYSAVQGACTVVIQGKTFF